jgi:hypothetical protein
MNAQTKQLVPGIVSYVTDHHGYVTKTKLLKILYLFDIEYYRTNRRTFTGFDWKFFHLGPWTPEYDPLISDLVVNGVLLEQQSLRSEYDTKFFRSAEPHDFSGVFSKFSDQAILLHVLNTWSESSTGEILDFVYFRTEPMEHGIRNERLDFSAVLEQLPPKYVRTASGATSKDIKKLRDRLSERMQAIAKAKSFKFTPPNYDEQFFSEMERLEKQS